MSNEDDDPYALADRLEGWLQVYPQCAGLCAAARDAAARLRSLAAERDMFAAKPAVLPEHEALLNRALRAEARVQELLETTSGE